MRPEPKGRTTQSLEVLDIGKELGKSWLEHEHMLLKDECAADLVTTLRASFEKVKGVSPEFELNVTGADGSSAATLSLQSTWATNMKDVSDKFVYRACVNFELDVLNLSCIVVVVR